MGIDFPNIKISLMNLLLLEARVNSEDLFRMLPWKKRGLAPVGNKSMPKTEKIKVNMRDVGCLKLHYIFKISFIVSDI